MLADLRFAIRTLLRSPLFTVVAILSLALGIGANTAIFTLLDQLMLRLLPVHDPQQLVMIWSTGPHLGNNRGSRAASYPMYQDFQQKAEAFSYVFCRYLTPLSISFEGTTERVNAELVSGNYFDALGVKPALGRVFSPENDDRLYKGHPSVVISYHYWASRFASDPKIVGKKLLVNNYPMDIVGVSAPGFNGLDPSSAPQIRIPIQMKPLVTPGWDSLGDRRSQWINLFARMKPGFTVEKAQASLQPLFHSILVDELQDAKLKDVTKYYRDRFLARQVKMEPAANGYSGLREQVSTALIVLMCMVGLVLLIACSNVANLLLARAVARQKEIAVRLAVGASRVQIIRQLLIESVLLSLAGGIAGLVLSMWIIRGLLSFVPQDTNTLMITAEPDLRILGFNFALAVFTGLLFGLVPAMQSTKLDLWNSLKDLVGNVAGASSSVRIRKILVTAQVALSFLLLIGAGLFMKTLGNLKNTNSGFRDMDNLVTFQVDPGLSGYSVERIKQFNQQLLDALKATPGVKVASHAAVPVLHGYEWDSSMSVEGHQIADGEDMQAYMNSISPGYFTAMGVPILEGRDFDQRDTGTKPTVIIVNRSFAKHFFGDRSAIGRHVGQGTGPKTKLEVEIIGVVEDSLYEGPREGVHRQAFLSAAQANFPGGSAFYIRTSLDSKSMFSAVRAAVRQIDASLPVYELKTVEDQLDETLSTERLIASLSSAFGILATLLAAIGLYGVMAFVVARRTKEIGLRMALGAARSNVVWLVMREVLILLGAGLAIGTPAAYFLSGYLSKQLYGVKPTDVPTVLVAVFVLALVASTAGFLPARRATAIDPMTALRYE